RSKSPASSPPTSASRQPPARRLNRDRMATYRDSDDGPHHHALTALPASAGQDVVGTATNGPMKLANPRLPSRPGTEASAAFVTVFPVAGPDVAVVEQAVVVDDPHQRLDPVVVVLPGHGVPGGCLPLADGADQPALKLVPAIVAELRQGDREPEGAPLPFLLALRLGG